MEKNISSPIISTTLLIMLLSIIYICADRIIYQHLSNLEEQTLLENFNRVKNLLTDDISTLNKQVGDWAGWDESCEFIETGNSDFIKRNLPDKSFADLQVNLIMFVHPSGQIVYERWFNISESRPTTSVAAFRKHLGVSSRLLNHPIASSSATGIIPIPDGLLMVSARPIVSTERTGPVRGTLIMGRYLNEMETGRLSKAAQVSFNLAAVDAPYVKADFIIAQNELLNKKSFYINPVEENGNLDGYGMIKDLYDNTNIVLKTSIKRTIFTTKRKIMTSILFPLSICGSIYLIIQLLSTHQYILSHNTLQNSHILPDIQPADITTNSTLHISIDKRDFISTLYGDGSIHRFSPDKFNSQLFDYNIIGVFIMCLDGRLILSNNSMAQKLGYTSAEVMLADKDFSPIFDKDDFLKIIQMVSQEKILPCQQIKLIDSKGEIINSIQCLIGIFDGNNNLKCLQGLLLTTSYDDTAQSSLPSFQSYADVA